MDLARLETEVDRNYEAFLTRLPDFLSDHATEFVLLRDARAEGFFKSEASALQAGRERFSDGIYSVQEITERPIDLGFYSHAIHPRIA